MGKTETISFPVGISQGCPLFPLLFNIVLDFLNYKSGYNKENCTCMFIAVLFTIVKL
jgi:hypothetical protein